MVNIHGCTRMMVNRCIELLRARIECAQTRHIARRYQRPRAPMRSQGQAADQAVREREKADSYNKNKRRSMWEQDDGYGGRISGLEDHRRLDAEQYRPKELEKRSYDCTWADFPEGEVEGKQDGPFMPQVAEEPPRRRRSQEERPNTARPWDDEAQAFISQWDNNVAMINRNKYVRSTDSCPAPLMTDQMENAMRLRKRQFFY